MTIEDEVKGHFRNEYHKGYINLIFTARKLEYQFLQSLKDHDMTEPQYNVLRVLRGFRSEGPASIGFIKERMLDQNSDVSRIVDKLVAKGYINRNECPNDRRQKSIGITEKGMALLDSMLPCEKKVDTALSNLTVNEINELSRLLDKIRD